MKERNYQDLINQINLMQCKTYNMSLIIIILININKILIQLA